jgi:hypothetical protein
MLRRLVLVAALIAAAVPATALDLNLTAGLDLGGSFDLGSISLDGDTGYTLGLEVVANLPIVDVGVGAEYGFNRSASGGLHGDLSFAHLYAVGRVTVFGPVYLAARLGYSDVSASNFSDGGASGGATWSVGGGFSFLGTLRAEALLNNVSGTIGDLDLDYRTWSVRLVYTF